METIPCPGAGPSRLSPRDTRGLVLLAVAAAGVYLACSGGLVIGQHVDDASYVMLGQALSRGEGYSRIAYPGHPAETKYPPLLPLLIAPCLWLSGGELWGARLPALLSAVLAIPVLWLLLRRFLRGPLLWLSVALVALHPLIVGYAGMAMSEAPGLLLTWLALLLTLRWEAEGLSRRRAAGLGLVLGAGLLTRTDLAVVAVAVVAYLLWRRRPVPAAVAALVCLALVAPWGWHVAHAGRPDDNYLREFAESTQDTSPPLLRSLHGARAYLGDLVPQVVALVFGQQVESRLAARGLGALTAATKWLTSLFLLAGLAAWWRRWPPLLNFLLPLKAAVLFAWHFRYTRFLLPLLPLLQLALATGLALPAWRDERRRERLAVTVLACLLAVAVLRDGLLIVRPPRAQYPDVITGGRLIRSHVPPSEVTLCSWSAKSFFLHARQPVLDLAPAGEVPLTAEEIRRQARGRADYVLLVAGEHGLRLDRPQLDRSPLLQRLAQSPDGSLTLYRLP